MLYANNKEFLESLEKDFPDTNWDNLPSEESQPDVWHVDALQWQRLHFYAQEARAGNNWTAKEERDIKSQIGFGFCELKSEEAAKKLLSEIQDPNSKWRKERFSHHETINVDGVEVPWSDEYMGPVIPETAKIRVSKSSDYLTLRVMADLRKQCLENPDEEIFPIYLP